MSKAKEEYRRFMKEVNRWKHARQIYWLWFTTILGTREQDCADYTRVPYSLYFTKEQQDRIRELMESYDKCNPDAARKLDPFMEEAIKWLDEHKLTRRWLAHKAGIPSLTMTHYAAYCYMERQ